MKTLILLSLLASSLISCATTYQRNGLTGGFDEIKLAEGMYQVSFKGNGFTSSGSVQKNFLRRCAELTLTDKYDYFVFLDQEAEANVQDTGTTYSGTTTKNYFGGYQTQGTIQNHTVTRHGRNGTIKMFKRGEQPQIAMDARQVLESLGVKIIEGDDRDLASEK